MAPTPSPWLMRECIGGPHHGQRMLDPEDWVKNERMHPKGHVRVTPTGRYVPGEREGRPVFVWVELEDGGDGGS